MSSPRPRAWPTALAWLLRAARSRSVSICQCRRCSSSACNAATSSAIAAPREIARDLLGSAAQQLRIDHDCRLRSDVRRVCAARVERLGDALLEAARRRMIIAAIRHVVGKIALAGRVGFRLIVRVAIAAAVAEFLHQLASARCANAAAPRASRSARRPRAPHQTRA